MSVHSEIDETLRRLGSAEPPSGLERRVNLRLQRLAARIFCHRDAHDRQLAHWRPVLLCRLSS